MTKELDLAGAVRSLQSKLEASLLAGTEAIAESARGQWDSWGIDSDQALEWELRTAMDDLLRLDSGGDTSYDQPSIGWLYATWYHPRRVNDLIPHLLESHLWEQEQSTVVDLGSGTGATSWALASIAASRVHLGLRVPQLEVRAFDSSPFMIAAAATMWPHLINELFSADGSACPIEVVNEPQSWVGGARSVESADLVLASFLFDASDRTREAELVDAFSGLVAALVPESVLVTTALTKQGSARASLGGLADRGWRTEHLTGVPGPFTGSIPPLRSHRLGVAGSSIRGSLLNSPPLWDEPVGISVLRCTPPAEHRQTQLFRSLPSSLPGAEQEEAAEPDDQMTIIRGAAGSGKTVVLVERLLRVVDRATTESPPRILVVTFNKRLCSHLDALITQGLISMDQCEVQRSGGDGDWSWKIARGDLRCSMALVNRDKLHKTLDIPHYEGIVSLSDTGAKQRDAAVQKITKSKADTIPTHLQEGFLEEEFARVVVGRRVLDLEDYLTRPRLRRGRVTPLNEAQRREVWSIIGDYPSTYVFEGRKWEALRRHQDTLDEGTAIPGTVWTHLFADECQDFTMSDFELFAAMVQDPSGLCVAGDEAQAIHLGSTYQRPGRLRGKRWKIRDLNGSYRVPLRLAQAVAPLAQHIQGLRSTSGVSGEDVAIPESRKASVIGPRPIVARSSQEIRTRVIASIIHRYLPFMDMGSEPVRVCLVSPLARGDLESSSAIAGRVEVEAAPMLKAKGLEYPVVVMRDTPGRNGEIAEGIYTAITRATGLCIVLLEADEPNETWPVLGLLDPQRLIFFDEESKSSFAKIRETSKQTAAIDLPP